MRMIDKELALNFKIIKQMPDSLARVGVIETPHGKIRTPCFISGGTQATVKTLTNEQIICSGSQAILANTYHLMLRPTADLIKEAGGVHKFMNWDKPMFTDSGGFQVFSLGSGFGQKERNETKKSLVKVTDEGVFFKSHLNGEKLFVSPEISMELQHKIGADIHMAFDELVSHTLSDNDIRVAMERTHRWAIRSLSKHQELNNFHLKNQEPLQALFGVVQGGKNIKFRQESARFLSSLDFDGFGIGGVFTANGMPAVLTSVNQILPSTKPRHLLGMGAQPIDLFLGVEHGIDTFDCVAPTRQARNGALFTSSGRININNSKFKNDFTPIDEKCECYTCRNHTKAYLHHLFRAGEVTGLTLASLHNEFFVIKIVDNIRDSLLDNNFLAYKESFLAMYYQENKNIITDDDISWRARPDSNR